TSNTNAHSSAHWNWAPSSSMYLTSATTDRNPPEWLCHFNDTALSPSVTTSRIESIFSRFSFVPKDVMKESDTYDNNIEQSAETVEAPTIVSRSDLTKVHEHANSLLEE